MTIPQLQQLIDSANAELDAANGGKFSGKAYQQMVDAAVKHLPAMVRAVKVSKAYLSRFERHTGPRPNTCLFCAAWKAIEEVEAMG